MLSKVDLRDFFEINQGLYEEPISPAQIALIQAMTQALERTAMGNHAAHRAPTIHDHDGSH